MSQTKSRETGPRYCHECEAALFTFPSGIKSCNNCGAVYPSNGKRDDLITEKVRAVRKAAAKPEKK